MSKIFILLSLITMTAYADPRPQMNLALRALSDLLPFLAKEEKFLDKKNEKDISQNLMKLENTFSNLKHDQMIKNDLFAPSYALIKQNISESVKAFKEGNKDFAHWRLSEITNQCLDCHTRLPESYTSKFQEKKISLDPKSFESKFDLATAQFIVRDYQAAEKTYIEVIESNLKNKNFMDTSDAFKNILVIRTKVKPAFAKMLELSKKYSHNNILPMDIQEELGQWEIRLKEVQKNKILLSPLQDDKNVKNLIATFLEPVYKKDDVFFDNYDVFLLVSSGLLSRYLFSHPHTDMAPEISYWLGWSEKVLKRDKFNSSGDLFFKQCIRRYPKSTVAPKCFKELKENTEFEFSGSAGTNIPEDLKKELRDLEALILK